MVFNAYSDSWIHRLAYGRSSLRGSSGSVMVHELISTDRIWIEVEVRAKFPSFEAELILDIPL